MWQNTIGGNKTENLISVDQTTDGGYILGGSSESSISGNKTENCMGLRDYWIVKTDSTGNIQWQNTIGGSGLDELHSIQQTKDGGYIMGGWSSSDISGDKTENKIGYVDYWIVKTDSIGNIQWQNTIGGYDYDYIFSICQSNDNGYLLGGCSSSSISVDKTENCIGNYDYWIVKVDSLGNVQWQNTIGGNDADILHEIKQTTDGGYILGGNSISNISGDKIENSNGDSDYWIVKVDSLGNIQWQNTIGGNDVDNLYSIQQTNDYGYIFGGYSRSNYSGDKTENSLDTNCQFYCQEDYWIVKTDSNGNILWQNTIGGIPYDIFVSLKQTVDMGYILGGFSISNISGDKTENCIGNNDYWIIKLAPDTITSTTNFQLPISTIQLSPNPASDFITIINSENKTPSTIFIKDVCGKIVLRKISSDTKITIDLRKLNSGIYFVDVQSENKHSVSKIIKAD